MNRLRFSIKQIMAATIFVGIVLASAIWMFGPRGALRDPVYDEPVVTDAIVPSRNIQKDRGLMWQTVPSKSGDFHVAPVSAINASRRVFESVQSNLIGKNKDEVRQLLGYQERPQYGYHGKFWDIKRHAYVYRFDCGSYGWQYNLYLDEKRIVEELEIRWIH